MSKLDLIEMRRHAEGWLRIHANEPTVTRDNALNEQHMALDINELCDEVERLEAQLSRWEALGHGLIDDVLERQR